ncbi:hypothetical protein BDV98DRAFT_91675 [Pterulicium gracile]|uniref:Secreted protein n=1 Tax=Pterulicium gracile TaxID=1884261 RepID=A0A5C3PZ38_9AGAR|nr:hypothetical protein BDV98DRAFT_91675 [Pterula gracilis]
MTFILLQLLAGWHRYLTGSLTMDTSWSLWRLCNCTMMIADTRMCRLLVEQLRRSSSRAESDRVGAHQLTQTRVAFTTSAREHGILPLHLISFDSQLPSPFHQASRQQSTLEATDKSTRRCLELIRLWHRWQHSVTSTTSGTELRPISQLVDHVKGNLADE